MAVRAYEQARAAIPALPAVDAYPDLTQYALNGMGVAALEDGALKGFLCSGAVFTNSFGTTGVKGVHIPIQCLAVDGDGAGRLYARMYQAAAYKWVQAGAASHSISIYAHNQEAQQQLFECGFGLRCVDAVRPMEPLTAAACAGFSFEELHERDFHLLYPLNVRLTEHFTQSPIFMCRTQSTLEGFNRRNAEQRPRYFAAFAQDKPIAYVKITEHGDNFATSAPDMRNITGAYCEEQYRGQGVFANLLNHMIRILRQEGYKRLGVDFESFNPTANGFWLKHFTAYTHSLVRRIDEYAINGHSVT